MKFKKLISICLILAMVIYIILSSFSIGGSGVSQAAGYVSLSEAESLCPGITSLVNSLTSSNSGYTFLYYNTGIDWEEAVLREYQGHGSSPMNLFKVGTKYSGMWYCPVCGTTSYDNGYCCASMDAIRYMMDPRNSLTADSVFQFKSLETGDVTYSDVQRVVSGTFLDDSECIQAIVDASTTYNINGYALVAKILTEQGTSGSTLSKGVTQNGVTYYNFFNYGATGNGSSTIIANGVSYAKSKGWTSKRASILGGAEIYQSTYVGKGQNTFYFQKFNVVNTSSGLFTHQYAQNILAAETEGSKLKSYYTSDGTVSGSHTFIIPLYTNMPSSACSRPSTATLSSITYETATVTASGGVKVRSAMGTSATQIGTIAEGKTVKVLIRASYTVDGYYWDLVISDVNGVTGYVARGSDGKYYITTTGSGSNSGAVSDTEYSDTSSSSSDTSNDYTVTDDTDGDTIAISGTHLELSATVTIDELLEEYPNIIITDTSGTVTTSLCTGYTVTIDGATYSLVKKGDVNGDGKVNVVDCVSVISYIKDTSNITDDAKIEAARVSGGTSVTVVDVVRILNYVKGSLSDLVIK